MTTVLSPLAPSDGAGSGLGLDADEERVYRSLLSRRRWQTVTLSRHCGLELTRLRAVLDQLSASGLVRHSGDEPGAFRAVEPAVALPGLAANAISHGAGAGTERTVSAAAVQRFVALHEAGDQRVGRDDEVMTGDDACAVVERLVARASSTLTFLVPHYAADGPHFSRPILEAALRRKLEVRVVWGGRVSGHIDAWQHGERLAAAGAVPQVSSTVPVSAVVIDDDAAVLLPVGARPTVVRDGEQLRALVDLADRLVANSTVIAALASRIRVDEPAPRCHSVLRLLAEGCTDDAMARRLGCSVRTIRNEVASAMSILNARSRFQAGVYAVQAGLI